MKSIVVAFLALAVALSCAEDDGKYHPELYGDSGKYNGVQDGKYYDYYRGYNDYYGRNGRYFYNPTTVAPYFSEYVNTLSPYQHLVAPVAPINSVELSPYASVPATVTYRPPVVTVTPASPKIIATPQPLTVVKPIERTQYNNDGYARIVAQDNDADANTYRYKYLTENGIAAEESGVADSVNGGGTRVSGFYEYVGDDGVKYRVDYTADENGFHPTGAHLP